MQERERNDNKNMVHTHCRVDRDVMHGLVEGAREREERQQEHGSHTLQGRQGCDAWFSGRCKREREERQQEHGSHTLQGRQGCDAWFSGRCKRERNANKNMVHTHCRVDRDVMHGLVGGAREREE